MQSELEQLEQRWGFALQSAGFGVWDLNLRTQQVHYSPQWKAMLGYGSADEPDATSLWRTRVHPEDLQAMLAALNGHLAGDTEGYAAEFRLRGADGAYRWVLSRGRVVERDASGVALRAVGTLTDLTDRRAAEQMRMERDRAEAANHAKTEFLSRMSHELRTPLNAVLGFAQLMKQRIGKAPPAEQQHHVEQIEKAGWQLLKLIEEVLALARSENARNKAQVSAQVSAQASVQALVKPAAAAPANPAAPPAAP